MARRIAGPLAASHNKKEMIQDSIVVKKRHQKFVDEIANSGYVRALKNNTGFATSSSNEFEDEEENAIGLICFWSDNNLAKVCAKEGWADYKPKRIRIEEFMESWCIGMFRENLMVGTNFDWNMFGFEIEPLELLIEVIEKLREKNKKLTFRKFMGIEDLESQIKKILDEDKVN